MREGVGPDGNWMIDLHQKFDFHEAVEVCRLLEPHRPFIVEDPLREEQFRTQLPKLRLMTIRAAGAGRGVGDARGLQSARRAAATSTSPASRCRTSAASPRC